MAEKARTSDAKTVNAIAERTFDLSVEHVFDAWCDADRVTHWFGPGLGPLERTEWSPREGATFRLDQRREDGVARHWGTFLEVRQPERLRFTWEVDGSLDADIVTFDFTADGEGCRQTATHRMDAAYAEYRDAAAGAWRTMMDAMAESLAREG